MSRRRKRKKERSSNEKAEPSENNASPPAQTPATPARDTVHEPEPASQKPIPAQKVKSNTAQNDLELNELDDFFDEKPASVSDSGISLPSPDDKKEMRTIRRATEPSSAENDDLESSPEPQKRQRMRKTSDTPTARIDELGHLEDDLESPSPRKEAPITPNKASIEKTQVKKPAPAPAPETSQPASAAETATETTIETAAETKSFSEIVKNALSSLSLIEQASIGLLAAILLVAAIWSTSIVSARIPNTIIASKLKYPLKGETVVIEGLETYWRSPIREGVNIDEGVSESIEIIPEVKITLHPKSTAKSLRLLFRDEEGRFVGDSSTVRISGSKFLPSENVTAITQGNLATIHATSGFQHEGELISYLADEKFQWEIVILESKNGQEFTEFMAIPISANRKDKS